MWGNFRTRPVLFLPLEGPSRFVIMRGTAISSPMLSNRLQACCLANCWPVSCTPTGLFCLSHSRRRPHAVTNTPAHIHFVFPTGSCREASASGIPGLQSSEGSTGTLFQVHGGGDEGIAFQNRPDGRNQVTGEAWLENIAESARGHRSLNKVGVGVHSQEDHLCR